MTFKRSLFLVWRGELQTSARAEAVIAGFREMTRAWNESDRQQTRPFIGEVKGPTLSLIHVHFLPLWSKNHLMCVRGELKETAKATHIKLDVRPRRRDYYMLLIEFFDDFRSGAYRKMPWWAVAVAATAMLYAINPADVIPNAIPLLGTMDDLAVVAVAVRLLRSELIKYCEFKGYPRNEYFRS